MVTWIETTAGNPMPYIVAVSLASNTLTAGTPAYTALNSVRIDPPRIAPDGRGQFFIVYAFVPMTMMTSLLKLRPVSATTGFGSEIDLGESGVSMPDIACPGNCLVVWQAGLEPGGGGVSAMFVANGGTPAAGSTVIVSSNAYTTVPRVSYDYSFSGYEYLVLMTNAMGSPGFLAAHVTGPPGVATSYDTQFITEPPSAPQVAADYSGTLVLVPSPSGTLGCWVESGTPYSIATGWPDLANGFAIAPIPATMHHLLVVAE
jgi:hypothetical protein